MQADGRSGAAPEHGMFARVLEKLWALAGSVSVQIKVLGIVLGVIVLLGLFVLLQNSRLLGEQLRAELGSQGLVIAHNLAEDLAPLLEANDREGAVQLMAQRRLHFSSPSHNTPVAYVVLTDASGGSLVASFRDDFSEQSLPPVVPRDSDRFGPVLWDAPGVVENVTSISGRSEWLRVGISTEAITATATTVTLQLFGTTLVMVAVGFGAAIFLTWVLTRPLTDLVNATQAVARGDFSGRVPRWANDEIGELADAFNSMTAALEQAAREREDRERLREQYLSGVILAQENERQRIARELHDSVSQSLTSLLVGLQNLRAASSADEFSRQSEALRGLVTGTLDETRALAWQLRPSKLQELGLTGALERYVTDYQSRYSIPVDLVVTELPEGMPPEIQTTIYRVVQEGLTNVARHARASAASVCVAYRSGQLRIIIEDNGVGFDLEAVTRTSKSLGLHGIRERAGLFSGTLQIETAPGEGASLYVAMPYPDPAP
jgi:signal transduction histidine kinase